ncbi:hypothetical protein E0Z10_g5357 [Xylaria hypoxylon]|uniref:Uncharacterized protein n=1 Tax=Xylaria hypoxylon TaxID=37992 RepID=A0A4Z0YIT1_9PEZI|nr:hypothetical protein E0Z10_g5357 [Xylaria hypoxylon]
MCINCAVACENDDSDILLKRALRRVDIADAGLSRLRGKCQSQRKETNKSPHGVTITAARQNQLGGDSSMDLVSPPPDISPPPSCPTESSSSVDERKGKRRWEEDDETIARLHYRRSRDPRFAELECLVPQHAALYVSIFDPVDTPAFRPSPAKPLPNWMRLLSCQNQRNEGKEPCERTWSPSSVLDVHFPPAEAFVRPCTDDVGMRSAGAGMRRTDKLNNETTGHKDQSGSGSGNGVDIIRPRACPPLSFISPSPRVSPCPLITPSPSPPLHQNTSDESISSQFSERLKSDCDRDGGSHDNPTPLPDFAYPGNQFEIENEHGIPPLKIYKRPSVVADEPLRLSSSRPMPVRSYERLDPKAKGDGDGYRVVPSAFTIADTTTNGDWNESKDKKPNFVLLGNCKRKGKGKGKSVAWDKTVEGGEGDTSDESCGQMPAEMESERGNMQGVERVLGPECPPKRCSSLLPAQTNTVWHQARTPPAQSLEFFDLYHTGVGEDNEKVKGVGKEMRLLNPSLAVSGRRRAREVGGAKACPTCGNMSNY